MGGFGSGRHGGTVTSDGNSLVCDYREHAHACGTGRDGRATIKRSRRSEDLMWHPEKRRLERLDQRRTSPSRSFSLHVACEAGSLLVRGFGRCSDAF